MNTFGSLLGLITLIVIGLSFFWVIRAERHLGVYWWPYFAASGLLLCIFSLVVASDWLSAVLGVQGACLIWGATELKEQAMRVELGWYPQKTHKIPPPFEQVIKKWPVPHL